MLTAQQELNRFLDRRATVFSKALTNLALAHNQPEKRAQAMDDIERLIRDTLILSDLHGRRRAIMQADAIRRWMERRASFATESAIPPTNPITPGVTFEEALDNLLSREPRLAKSASEVSRLYNTEHVFAAARSATTKLTERVQKAIGSLISSGKAGNKTENEIIKMAAEESQNWTRAYAGTVYRTNASTAYNQGMFEQSKDPEIAAVAPAFKFEGIADSRERSNHAAARGLIMAVDDPRWNQYKPPFGYQCRHYLRSLTRFELERLGLWKAGQVIPYYPARFSEAHPDQGFNAGEF